MSQASVDLNPHVSLDEFLDESARSAIEKADRAYSIKSVVHHIGNTSSSGHYTTDALRDGTTWVSFDDGVTKEIVLDDIVKSPRKQRSAYMIMYSLD